MWGGGGIEQERTIVFKLLVKTSFWSFVGFQSFSSAVQQPYYMCRWVGVGVRGLEGELPADIAFLCTVYSFYRLAYYHFSTNLIIAVWILPALLISGTIEGAVTRIHKVSEANPSITSSWELRVREHHPCNAKQGWCEAGTCSIRTQWRTMK